MADVVRREFEYIVIGLGGLGSGAAYWLARRAGGDVLGIEQFELGHDKGASEDHSRIIRLSYHTPTYVELAHHAYDAWDTLAEEAGEPLVLVTGGLDLFPANAAISIADYSTSMAARDVPFETLDAVEIMHRWPQFQLNSDVVGLYQARSGLAMARKGNAAHQRAARRHGATLLEHTPVTRIKPLSTGVEVVTAEATFRCRRLVIAADAWTNQLLAPLGITLPLTLTQEQVTYYASPHLDHFQPDRFPIWIWMDDPSYYGFPVFGESAGVKVAQDVGGREITLETRTFDANPETAARVAAFTQRHLPDAFGPVLYHKTCVYTMPPDRDFIIDTLPEYPQISVALGAGHAYKFAGIIGRILGDLAIEGDTEFPIEPFTIDRPILTMENPPKNFMV
jgi:sarcosine oxidase